MIEHAESLFEFPVPPIYKSQYRKNRCKKQTVSASIANKTGDNFFIPILMYKGKQQILKKTVSVWGRNKIAFRSSP